MDGVDFFELPVTFFGSIWKDTGDIQGLMSRILKDVAYCIGIFFRDLVILDLVDSLSCDSTDLGSRKLLCCGILWILDLVSGLCNGILGILDPVEPFCRRILWISDPVFLVTIRV